MDAKFAQAFHVQIQLFRPAPLDSYSPQLAVLPRAIVRAVKQVAPVGSPRRTKRTDREPLLAQSHYVTRLAASSGKDMKCRCPLSRDEGRSKSQMPSVGRNGRKGDQTVLFIQDCLPARFRIPPHDAVFLGVVVAATVVNRWFLTQMYARLGGCG